MKEFYPAILAPLITQAAAERNQSAALVKDKIYVACRSKFKFISYVGANMKALFFILASVLFLKAESVSEIYSLGVPACDTYDLNSKKCSSGDGEACYLAALILNNRSCARKNDGLALEFFEKSCSLGYAKGCIFMG